MIINDNQITFPGLVTLNYKQIHDINTITTR